VKSSEYCASDNRLDLLDDALDEAREEVAEDRRRDRRSYGSTSSFDSLSDLMVEGASVSLSFMMRIVASDPALLRP